MVVCLPSTDGVRHPGVRREPSGRRSPACLRARFVFPRRRKTGDRSGRPEVAMGGRDVCRRTHVRSWSPDRDPNACSRPGVHKGGPVPGVEIVEQARVARPPRTRGPCRRDYTTCTWTCATATPGSRCSPRSFEAFSLAVEAGRVGRGPSDGAAAASPESEAPDLRRPGQSALRAPKRALVLPGRETGGTSGSTLITTNQMVILTA